MLQRLRRAWREWWESGTDDLPPGVIIAALIILAIFILTRC